MTEIGSAIADYLAVRRALGYKLADHGWLLDRLRVLSGSPRREQHHHRAGAGVGHRA